MKKKLLSILRLFRFAQWLKNTFIFAPLIFSKHLFDLTYLWHAVLAFIAFSLTSSVVYIVNDIVDKRVDKLHPVKRNRPIASGIIKPAEALIVIAVIIFVIIQLLPFLNIRFWYTVAMYALLNLAYSFWLKQIVLVDVFIIASGFMLRVLAGVFAIEVVISSWLVLCTLFISVFLAVSKRRGEVNLMSVVESYEVRPVLKYYEVNFIDQMMTVAAAGVTISYALYTVADRTISTFKTENLIFTTMFVLFGVFRYIFLMRNRKTDDNPMHILLSDKPIVLNILFWFISCVIIIYSQEFKNWIF